jgi:hypothetical protein
MTFGLRTGALALGLIGSAALLSAPSYAIEGDIEVEPAGVDVEIVRDRAGILGRRHADPDIYIETPGPDVYVEDDDDDDDAYAEDDHDDGGVYVDAPPATVEIDPY